MSVSIENESNDERWMREALRVAAARGTDPAVTPIGAVVVLDGRVIGEGPNRVAEDHDPTAHAEMVAIRAAARALGTESLAGATLYSTLQPCGMCTMASIWAKLGRVVFGAGRDDVHRMYFEDRHLDTLDFVRDAWRGDLVYQGGVLRRECARLYYHPGDAVPAAEQGNT